MKFSTTDFKSAMAQFASGVTVVTTLYGDTPLGITVSAFTSVSVEPPLILVNINQNSFSHRAIIESGFFAVHILADEQRELGMRFAGMIPDLSDRFAGLEIKHGASGSPILAGCLAWLDCRLWASYPGGGHTIFVGEVLELSVGASASPLLYFNRDWRKLAS